MDRVADPIDLGKVRLAKVTVIGRIEGTKMRRCVAMIHQLLMIQSVSDIDMCTGHACSESVVLPARETDALLHSSLIVVNVRNTPT